MEKYFFLRAIENREMYFYCVSMENLYTSQICNLYRISQDLLSFISRMFTRKRRKYLVMVRSIGFLYGS